MTRFPLPNRRILLSVLAAATASCATASAAQARSAPLRTRLGPYELETLVDGMPATSYAHGGETYILGRVGARYTLRVYNRSSRRVEAVVSVDGRDVVDGHPADFQNKRGYLIQAGGYVDIDGWRTSQAEVAAFRFSSVARSYAARTGSAREVGVIGVAIFPEQYQPPPPPPPRPLIRPWRDYDDGRDEEYEREDFHAKSGAAPAPAPEAPSAGRAAPAPHVAADDTLAEESEAPESSRAARSRPGLGTEYGEAVDSPVYEVPFVRMNPSRPSAVLGARYNDRVGLVAMGIELDTPPWYSEAQLRQSAEPFPVSERRYTAPPPPWR